jgi:two-component system, NtrC family, sensor kinase
LGGVPCGVEDRVRERREGFFAANECRRVCNDWPLVAALLLVLSLIVAGLGLRRLRSPQGYREAMKRRSKAGSKASKARGREALKTKRRDAFTTVPSFAPIQDAEVARLTRELNEALERQAATSEVLEVISGSPGDLQPVFDAMLENAVRLCDATFGNINRWDGEALHVVATHNTPPAFAEARKRLPIRPGPKGFTGRMVATKAVIHVADIAAERAYTEHRVPETVAAVELGGIRTFLAVPIMKENELVGSFNLSRQ